jgi:hypothetical protein
MSSRYVELPAKVLEQFLAEKGFSRTVSGHEIVYVREVVLSINGQKYQHLSGVKVKVFTSLSVGAEIARGPGMDAVRVVCAYQGQKAISPWRATDQPRTSFGIFKGKRIHRTGSVAKILDRLHDRMREAYATGLEFISKRAREFEAEPVVPPAPVTRSPR